MTNIHWETRPVWNFDVASDYTADAWTGDTSLSAAPRHAPIRRHRAISA